MSVSDSSNGWRAALRPVLEAGVRIRSPRLYDEAARNASVNKQIAAAGKSPWWILFLVIPAWLLPSGLLWVIAIVSFWGVLQAQALHKARRLRAALAQETVKEMAQWQQNIEMFERAVLEPANRGERRALEHLLRVWLDGRPQSIRHFSAQLESLPNGGYQLRGTAIGREMIAMAGSTSGRGKQRVLATRTMGEINEDLVELNAAAALSLLIALFGGTRAQRVELTITLRGTPAGDIPWVTLAAQLDAKKLQSAIHDLQEPSVAMRSLGGDVGRCRGERFTLARELASSARAGFNDGLVSALPEVPRQLDKELFLGSRSEQAPVRPRSSVRDHLRGTYARVGAEPRQESFSEVSQKVPPRPPDRAPAPRIPLPSDMSGAFGVTAKKWAYYEGNPDASFVPFHCYYPTYSNLDSAQLAFYFGWRTAFRNGKTMPTDLSYLFLHVYELLHIVGVRDSRHAAIELERLWSTYRLAYSTLDKYLVPWLADLYAKEGLPDEVGAWYRRALATGVSVSDREIVTDLFWIGSDYTGMPKVALATLAGDPKLGVNKFCLEHNQEGWVEEGYRQALIVADQAFKAKHGRSLRPATIAQDGFQPFTRQPFKGAVYDWTRYPITLGKHPNLSESSLAVRTFRAATRHAENILREERGFRGRLRGIELDGDVGGALDAHFARFIKATRPRQRIVIDLAKANQLKQESSDVRKILLAGLDEQINSPVSSASPFYNGTVAPAPTSDDHIPAGLLTDLTAVQAAVAACSAPARALLEALAGRGWESSASDPDLKVATGGALIGPLIDEINSHAVETVRDLLIVAEENLYVIQEDFRDEIHWVFKRTLAGFEAAARPPVETISPLHSVVQEPEAETYGFGPLELQALGILAAGDDVERQLNALGSEHALSALLLIDRINDLSRTSPYGDILIDTNGPIPTILEDGLSFAQSLVARKSQMDQVSCVQEPLTE